MSSEIEKHDPIFLNYNFIIEIDGIEKFYFKEMSELSNETEVETYEEGGLNGYVHRFPKHTEYSTITLKRGLGIDNELYEWRQLVINGQMDKAKKDGTIKFYKKYFDESTKSKISAGTFKRADASYTESSKVFGFYNAWPSKLEISEVDASSNGEVVIESVELVLERFESK